MSCGREEARLLESSQTLFSWDSGLLAAVRTTKAFYLLGMSWKSAWVKVWSFAWYGWWDTPTMINGEQHGRHRKGGWRVTFIRLSFPPHPWLSACAARSYPDLILFKVSTSSLHLFQLPFSIMFSHLEWTKLLLHWTFLGFSILPRYF